MNQSLYNKYRPRLFDDMVGQSSAVKVVSSSLLMGDFPRGWLFTGPYGTGKTSLARIYSKSLLCTGEKEGLDSCGTCQSCLDFDNQCNFNYIEEDSASKSGVGDIDAMLEDSYFYPVNGGKYKIFVLDECHLISSVAQSRLLKVLEEDRRHAVFIFVTTNPDKILETIKSRLARVNLLLCSKSDILNRLRYVCELENIEYDDYSIEYVAFKSAGHLRDALNMLEQLMYLGGAVQKNSDMLFRNVSEEKICDVFFNLVDNFPVAMGIFEELLFSYSVTDLRASLLSCLNKACEFALMPKMEVNQDNRQYRALYNKFSQDLFTIHTYIQNQPAVSAASLKQALMVVACFIKGIEKHDFDSQVRNGFDALHAAQTKKSFRKVQNNSVLEEITPNEFCLIIGGEIV